MAGKCIATVKGLKTLSVINVIIIIIIIIYRLVVVAAAVVRVVASVARVAEAALLRVARRHCVAVCSPKEGGGGIWLAGWRRCKRPKYK